MVVAPIAGIIAPRVGTRALIVAGLALQAVALAWLAAMMTPTSPTRELVAPFIVAGIGMGLVFAPSATAVLATLGPDDHAKASGTNSTLREIGVALGIAVLTAVFVSAGGELTPELYVDAARPAVFTGAAVLLAATVAGLWLPNGRSGRGVDADAAAAPTATETPALQPVG